MSILGGMELFVFGLISAPGIQMLVDQQVNYKKISNQIITAAVLLAGISDISIVYETLTLRGMSLGLTIGVIVNLIALLLKRFGLLNEKYSIVEIIDECIVILGSTVHICMYEDMKVIKHDREIRVEEIKDFIRKKENVKLLNAAAKIELQDCFSKKRILLLQRNGRIELQVALPQKYRNKLFNDNSRIVATQQNGKEVKIVLDENVSNRLLGDILENAI